MLNRKQIFYIEQIIQNCQDRYDIDWDNLYSWCKPMSEYKMLVHPVYYNGVELPHHYYMIQGLLYRQCEGNFIKAPIYSNGTSRGMKYKIWINGKTKSVHLGTLIKSNYIIPQDFHVHHLDNDESNNDPTNLVMLDPTIHNTHHGIRRGIKLRKCQFFNQYLE